HVGTVLVHQGEALGAAVLGPGLVDEHDLGVEIALFAGEALVNLVGDQMAEPAPLRLPDGEALLRELAAREHVPQTELANHPAIRGALGPADDEGLGIEDAPVLQTRRGIEITRLLQERSAVE